jgi:hypothetical protein
MNSIDLWDQIVSGLCGRTAFTVHPSRKPGFYGSRERCNSMKSAMAHAWTINRIEWLSTRTILVSWSHSTLGRYEDQTWRAGIASTPGICGHTGVPVRRGDAVFRPLQRVDAPLTNAPHMILADTLPSAEETDDL